jgi:hypothetical protein
VYYQRVTFDISGRKVIRLCIRRSDTQDTELKRYPISTFQSYIHHFLVSFLKLSCLTEHLFFIKSSIFLDITQCTLLKVNDGSEEEVPSIFRVRIREERTLLTTCFMLVSCLAYSSTLKMEATCSSDMSPFNGLHGYIPDDRTLHSHRCESLKWSPLFYIVDVAASTLKVSVSFLNLLSVKDCRTIYRDIYMIVYADHSVF